MNLAGVVILYHPDKDLMKRVSTYQPHIRKLYVVDNSEKADVELHRFWQRQENVLLIHNGKNEGIAKRLNEAAALAINDGFDWLLTMDQDSFFKEGLFAHYLQCIKRYGNPDRVAMFGVEYDERLYSREECAWVPVNHLITSGSLVNLKLFPAMQGFDEALFIDNVDHEYCFHARVLGYDIIKFSSILLTHTLGVVSSHRSLKSFKRTPRTLHSPVRMYYTIRNYLYLKKKYAGHFAEDFREIEKSLLNRIKNNILYHQHRVQIVKNIFRGYRDFKRKKMGKIS